MAYSRAAIRAPAAAAPRPSDDNLDSDEEREERMLSELHGEAGDDTGATEAPSGKRKRQALTASTEEDASASAEFEERMRRKRLASRPALDASHLKGPRGLVAVRRSFPGQVRRFRHAAPPAAAANRPSRNPRSAAIAARLATRSTLDAAASYSSSLMAAYDGFARAIFPSLAAADVFLKIESLGSKKEVKDYLQVMRDDMRREYLIGVLGKERTDRILHELEYGMRASVSLQNGLDVRRGDIRGRDELDAEGGGAGGDSDDEDASPSGAPRERAANPYATRAGAADEGGAGSEASQAADGADGPNGTTEGDGDKDGEGEDDEAEAEATFDDVTPTQTARDGGKEGEDGGDDEMAEAEAKESSSDALRMMMAAGDEEAPAASEKDVEKEPEEEPEEEPARDSDGADGEDGPVPPSTELAREAEEEEDAAGNEGPEEEERGTQETLVLVPGADAQEGEKEAEEPSGTQETLTLVPGEGGGSQETLTLVPGDGGGTQETLTMAATQFAEAEFGYTQDGDEPGGTQGSRFSQTQGAPPGGTQDDDGDERFSQTQDDGLTQDDDGGFGPRDIEPLVVEEVERGGDASDEEVGAGGDRLGQTMDTQISQEY